MDAQPVAQCEHVCGVSARAQGGECAGGELVVTVVGESVGAGGVGVVCERACQLFGKPGPDGYGQGRQGPARTERGFGRTASEYGRGGCGAGVDPCGGGLLYCERSGWYSQTFALVPWRWTTMSVGRDVPRSEGDTRSENAMVTQRSLCTKMLEVLVAVWIVTCVACRTLAAAAVPGVMVITLVGASCRR